MMSLFTNVFFTLLQFNWSMWLCCSLLQLSALLVFNLYNLAIIINSAAIVNLILFLYKSSRCYFKILYDIFALDYLNIRFLRFEVITSVLSLLYNSRIQIHYYILENNVLLSLSKYFVNAIFFECEIWDMFGLGFIALKKSVYHIFLDYGFKGYPLRKDFVLEGYSQLYYGYLKCSLNIGLYRPNCSSNIVVETCMWKVAD